jgi:hypothetical protein
VFFDKHKDYQGEYGFEKYKHSIFTDTLCLERIKVNNLDYYVPWLSLQFEQTANLEARIFIPSLYSGLSIKFESSNTSKIQIAGIAEYDSTTLTQLENFSEKLWQLKKQQNYKGQNNNNIEILTFFNKSLYS